MFSKSLKIDIPITEKINLTDENLIDSLDFFRTNLKVIDVCANANYIAGAGTKSQDTTNVVLGTESLKLLENDNTASTLYCPKQNITLDLTVFDDGTSSGTSDYIYLVCYVSDVTKINSSNGMTVRFSQGATYDAGNLLQCKFTSLVTGWNYLKILKSDATVLGSGAWTGIQSIQLAWVSVANSQNAYVSFQLIGLLKANTVL